MAKYSINQGNRDYAVRLGIERGLYDFLSDYAADMGMSRSAAVRRLVLIGARCEKEHGNARMPASYEKLFYEPEEIVNDAHSILDKLKNVEPEFDWGE